MKKTNEQILNDAMTLFDAITDISNENKDDLYFEDYVSDFYVFLACTVEDWNNVGTFTTVNLENAEVRRDFVSQLYGYLNTLTNTFMTCLRDASNMYLSEKGKIVMDLRNDYFRYMQANLKI